MTKDQEADTFDDEGILENLNRDSKALAKELIQEDEESAFGIMFYEATKDTNKPRNVRRGAIYELRAKRIKRLAQITMELTPFQERFVHHYVQKNWDSLSDVAILAGSTANGSQNLRNVAWQTLRNKKGIEAIGLLTYSKLEAEGIDRHEVVAMFRNNHAIAISESDIKEANVAAEKLGVIVGLFPSKGLSAGVAKSMTKLEQEQLGSLAEANKNSGGNRAYADPPSDTLTITEDLKDQLKIARSKGN